MFPALCATTSKKWVSAFGTRCINTTRILSAKDKKGGGSGPKEVRSGTCDVKVVTGLNIMKAGTDPAIGPTESYPEWLWTLIDEPGTLGELNRKKAAGHEMDEAEVYRQSYLARRRAIKQNNDLREK
ncbi:hypothetical protein CYMTET_32327 [Cymbomonas tetramitiformis]|uniref:Large ribosomal subunit protein mL54 n=1 Tax=Cymbomonas tetramitiformis TaxID=36881 RepID=A0AAE0FFZ6_9CHLO|nr:hypothetical protein CYMTET_32327 [Cymbomonas tetramitiformis]